MKFKEKLDDEELPIIDLPKKKNLKEERPRLDLPNFDESKSDSDKQPKKSFKIKLFGLELSLDGFNSNELFGVLIFIIILSLLLLVDDFL